MKANIEKGRYRHYKGGLYQVLGTGYDEKNQREYVIYKMLYSTKDYPKGTIWLRELGDFCSMVEVEGEKVKRYSYLGKRS
ncbi:MAG: hypothetical protein BWY43_00751 [candidate division WS2 bacterium ADurb.Bin280]|uniref:DUF1653 domain-containing protein n=1 Tax=candidate division WS2 bacterium ADurb.Bin280 TaxID=1852829 RepID=A0A1V5SBI5_9BACT|nr:MAG: hypothetical protein BWY43_00751 [candidate division WS2 bacterium ADurb.Bin280]